MSAEVSQRAFYQIRSGSSGGSLTEFLPVITRDSPAYQCAIAQFRLCHLWFGLVSEQAPAVKGKLVERRVWEEGHDGLQPDSIAAKHCNEGSFSDLAEEAERI